MINVPSVRWMRLCLRDGDWAGRTPLPLEEKRELQAIDNGIMNFRFEYGAGGVIRFEYGHGTRNRTRLPLIDIGWDTRFQTLPNGQKCGLDPEIQPWEWVGRAIVPTPLARDALRSIARSAELPELDLLTDQAFEWYLKNIRGWPTDVTWTEDWIRNSDICANMSDPMVRIRFTFSAGVHNRTRQSTIEVPVEAIFLVFRGILAEGARAPKAEKPIV